MRILILTDISDDSIFYNEYLYMLHDLQGNHDIKVFHINEVEVTNCLACYTCWIKSPGICLLQDQFDQFKEKFYRSDKLIVFSKILFGCYSNKIKLCLERLLINMLPFLEYRYNKMYHSTRYSKLPEYIMVGYHHDISQKERDIFFELVKANAANIKQNKYTAVILTYCSFTLISERLSDE